MLRTFFSLDLQWSSPWPSLHLPAATQASLVPGTVDCYTVPVCWQYDCLWGMRHGCYHPFEIGWSNYSLGLPSAPLHYGLKWPVGIPTVFQTLAIVPLHCPDGRQVPAVGAVQGDCERVYGHSCLSCPSRQEFEDRLDASEPARSGTPGSTTHMQHTPEHGQNVNIKTVFIDGFPLWNKTALRNLVFIMGMPIFVKQSI